MIQVKLQSENGTQKTIDDLEQVKQLLGNAFERIIEINKGSYKREQDSIQFDYCTCPALSNLVCDIEAMLKKIDKVVFQKRK